jgi:hypothetical protein
LLILLIFVTFCYQLFQCSNPYKFKLRLKLFVTSQARNDIANFSIQHGLKNEITIATGCVSFSKDINNDDVNYGIKDKTTGLIHFYNVNKYENLTTDYRSKIVKLIMKMIMKSLMNN